MEELNIPKDSMAEANSFSDKLSSRLDNNQEVVLALNDVITKLKAELGVKIQEVTEFQSSIRRKDSQIEFMDTELAKLENDRVKEKEQLEEDIQKAHKLLTEKQAAYLDIEQSKEDLIIVSDKEKAKFVQLIEVQKKELGVLNNRIGVLNKRIQEIDEEKRTVLLKAVEVNKKLAEKSLQLSEAKAMVEENTAKTKEMIEKVREDYSEKSKQIIADNTRRVVAMMAQIEGLKKELIKRDSIISQRDASQHALLTDFVEKLKAISSDKSKIDEILKAEMSEPIEKTKIESLPERSEIHPVAYTTETLEPIKEPFKDIFADITAEAVEEEEIELPMPESDIALLGPMIERAIEQGDKSEDIIDSLVCSGYHRTDILEKMRELTGNFELL